MILIVLFLPLTSSAQGGMDSGGGGVIQNDFPFVMIFWNEMGTKSS